MTAYDEFKREYLCDDISVSYTLKIDDITKGEKPPMSPYASRKESFSGGFAPITKTRLTIKRDGSGYMISARSASDELSQFGLNIPFNFMGKKTAAGGAISFCSIRRIPRRTTGAFSVILLRRTARISCCCSLAARTAGR